MVKWFSCVNGCIFLIVFMVNISSILATARFTQFPPSVLYVSSGGTARFVWDYHVDDRRLEFHSFSPVWSFTDKSGNEMRIGYDDKYTNNWSFIISRGTCPSRLLNPDRVSKEPTATLVITSVTTADNGIYNCSLKLKAGNPINHQVQLEVIDPPRFNPQPPLTKSIVEGQDLSVPCTAIGPPTPNIKWIQVKGNVTKSTGTGSATLRIPNIRREQNGTYECQAWNDLNKRPVTARTAIVVYYQPSIIHDKLVNKVVVNESDFLSIKCEADGNPPPIIKWKTPTGSVDTGNVYNITSVSRSHAGTYTCTASNGIGREAMASLQVTVQYQPSIINNNLLNKVVVNESNLLSIKCDADGNPPPTIKWKTPTGSVHTGNVYNIPSVSRSHAGTYTCTASNGIGREAMASVQVTVQYPPDIDTSKSNLTSKSWNGNSIRLRCFATGLPAPRISWYKPTNQQITTGVNILPEGSELTVLTTNDQGDYGQYKCQATNILGTDEHAINVTQLFPPGPATISITVIEASSITVRWTKPADDGGSPVTGYLMEVNTKPPVNTVNTHAVITGLKANTQYTVKVYAQNVVGNSNVSVKTITTKKQGKPSVPQLTLFLVQENGLSVKLSWTKPDDNGGEIANYTIYMKEDGPSELKNIHNILNPKVLEYKVKNNLKYGKIYKFLVTAWNKYGESAKQEELAKPIEIPEENSNNGGNKDKRSSDDNKGSDSSVIGIAVGAALFMLIVAVILGIIIMKKKGLLSKGLKTRKSPSGRASYDNDIDPDSATQQAAAAGLGGADDGIPTYAAVDMSKKKKKVQDDIPDYAAVDKSKKKRPGEIIYAELADFNTAGSAAAAEPRPITYTGTDYADITQFQKQDEPEPTYANFPGRGKAYTNIQGM